MARNAGISARISGDPKPLKQSQDAALNDTQAWINKMVGLNSSIKKSYASLAFAGPGGGRMKSPIQQMAEEDARAWARRMSDTQKHTQAWGRQMSGGAGMAALQTAQAVDDLQYGIKGVLNNIPGLVMSLGGGAGLAGVLSLVAVGAATVGKRLFDLWTNAKLLKEVTSWVGEMNDKLKEAARDSGKEALTGTAEGADALAAAVARANEALNENQRQAAAAAARTKELIQAEAALAAAKAGGDGVGQVEAQQRIEVEMAKELHRATVEQMKAEREAAGERAMALDDYAKKVEAAARAARARSEGLDPGADPFIRETVSNQAAAAEVDAAKARAEATKAHNESLKEQQRLSEEIAHRQQVHAKELEALWARTNAQVSEARKRSSEQGAAARDAAAADRAAAEEKQRKEDEAATRERRRALEDQRDDLERQIRARDGAVTGEVGTAAVGGERSRRINARPRPARGGFGVDDVLRLQRGNSLRADMDAAIGPVGMRRPTAATDKQAHQMKIQQANQGGDPLLTALAKVEKQLEAINRNTEGMQKSKSEALVRQ